MLTFLDGLRGAARHASQRVRKSPAFFLAAILTLALGIGANAAMFSVVYGVLLKPLPFDQPERLVAVWNTAPGIGWPRAWLAPALYFTYREEQRVFEDVAVWTDQSVTVTGTGEPERLPALVVTDGFLPLLRVQALLGRRFTREDDSADSPRRAMLTYGYWQRRFGGDPHVVGRVLAVNGNATEVIGVLPREYTFFETNPALLIPARFDRTRTQIQDFSYRGVARLGPNTTIERANADVVRMIPLTLQKFPMSAALGPTWFSEAKMGADVHPLADDAAGSVGRVLWVLMGTIGIVFLIACANVANLFLVRAEGRQQELAVRSALGASRARLARALLAESVSIGVAGGVVGVGLAEAAIAVIRATAPDALPRVSDIALHPLVLLFASALSVASGLFFGAIPVLKFASPRLAALKDGGRGASDSRDRHRTRGALVVAQIALALVLLIGSGLMIRSFRALTRVDPGFVRGDEVLTFRLALTKSPGMGPEQVAQKHQRIAERIRQVPGVQSVGLASVVALDGSGMSNPMLVEDFPTPEGQAPLSRRMKWIAPGYFETMGTRLVVGRHLTWTDLYAYAPVVLINERMAREYWKTPSAAIGRRIRESARNPWREIIGVVADQRDDGLAQDAPPTMYWPSLVKSFWTFPIASQASLTYVVRAARTGSPGFANEVRQAVWSLDPNLPLANVTTVADIASASMAQTAFALVMLGLASGVALLLGIVGIYGVIAYIAAQRTREVGIRMALGAQPWDIACLFARYGVALAAIGITLGVGGAIVLSRVIGSMLFGVSATDPLTYVMVSLGLAGIALVAGYVPSRRAAKMHPVAALRS